MYSSLLALGEITLACVVPAACGCEKHPLALETFVVPFIVLSI